mmetsp:Transcript_15684/g.59652  ORF Transcript_15684/g.59652 Transcript_15684/m.59652 type:complete len:339 (-) Transcript_15684:227-1243(-)
MHRVDVGAGVQQDGDGVREPSGRGHDEGREPVLRHVVRVGALLQEELDRRHGAVLGGVDQRRDAILILREDVRPCGDQGFHGLRVAHAGGRHESGDAVAAAIVGIRTLLEEGLHQFRLALRGCEPHGRHARGRLGLELRAGRQQQLHNVPVVHDRRFHERRDVVLVLGVDVRLLLDEQLADAQMAGRGRRDQRGQVVPVPGVDVDSLLQVLLHHPLIPVRGRGNHAGSRRRHGLQVVLGGELQEEQRVAIVTGGDHRLRPIPLEAVLAPVFRQHVARLGISKNVPRLGAAVVAAAQAERTLTALAHFPVQAKLVLLLVDGSVVQLVGSWLARDVPERV